MKRAQRIRDELLVLRAQAAPAGFEELVTRWHSALLRHAVRMTGSEDAANDIVQEGWCAIVRNIHALHEPAAFPRWAFQIVTNKCRDWTRKRNRRHRLLDSYGEETGNCPPVVPPKHSEKLDGALQALDPDLRILVFLYYEESFAVKEIACIVGLKHGTVKSRLHRARQELRRILRTDEHRS